MGKYFHIVDKEVLDWKFTKHPNGGGWYKFYIGDIFIGICAKHHSGPKQMAWCAISWQHPDPVGLVEGFHSRQYAAIYLLKIFDLARGKEDA